MALSIKGAKVAGYKAGLEAIKKLLDPENRSREEISLLALETDIAADYLNQFGEDSEVLGKVIEKFDDGVYAAIADINGFIMRQQASGSPLGGF